jgi:hypothetical protein
VIGPSISTKGIIIAEVLMSLSDGGGVNSMLQFQLESGGDGTKHCQKMKQRQGAHLGSMGMKYNMLRRHGDVCRRRDDTREEKERRQYQLG